MTLTVDGLRPQTDDCAREPIRTPGHIQPHGALVVLGGDDLCVLQASANAADILGADVRPGTALSGLLGPGLTAELEAWRTWGAAVLRTQASLAGRWLTVSAHKTEQGLMLEFEPAQTEGAAADAQSLRSLLSALEDATSLEEVAQYAVSEVSRLTGFSRTLLYSFDDDGVGTVLAESNDGALPSCLDLRFPGSDIPAQARQLYVQNRVRLIPDADYAPVEIEPAESPLDGHPLDLSDAALRSVSPVHLQYMRNMGTLASMSISLIVDGALWGMISCHHPQPRRLAPAIRETCDLIGQIVAMQMGARERVARTSRLAGLQRAGGALLARLGGDARFDDALLEAPQAWLAFMEADGAAVVGRDGVVCIGDAPPHDIVAGLADWLAQQGQGEVFATDCLGAVWPPAREIADTASGVLAISVSRLTPSYILWFRREVVRTVTWGGDPRKNADQPLSPRRSFEAWKEQVRGRSRAWGPEAVEAARTFRTALVDIVLKSAETNAALADELRKMNAELEAFSYSISHDLRAPFRHIAGYAELLSSRETRLDDTSRHYLESIVEAALHAGRLVDDLLNFSQTGRSHLAVGRVDMKKLVDEVRLSLATDEMGRRIEWRVGALPIAWGDHNLLRQVWANLLDNALKYTRDRDPAIITIEAEQDDHEQRFLVRDNGVGFDMAYSAKLFSVFQRLHRSDEYPGTGIGLALVRRIVERHGGGVWAQGELGVGASFAFSLPVRS